MVQVVAGTGGVAMDSGRPFNNTFTLGEKSNPQYVNQQNTTNGVVRVLLRPNGNYNVKFYPVGSTAPADEYEYTGGCVM
jgi:hypothetical protein